MRKLTLFVLALALGIVLGARAQTVATAAAASPIVPFTNLPTMIGMGGAFNQMGTPRESAWLTGIIPFQASAGMYSITTSDLLPTSVTDSATGRRIYTLTGTLRTGVCKTLRPLTGNQPAPSDMLLLCGDAGFGISQASTTGAALNVSVTAAVGLPYIHQFNAHWALLVELRGVWVPTLGTKGAWNFIPELGVVWKP